MMSYVSSCAGTVLYLIWPLCHYDISLTRRCVTLTNMLNRALGFQRTSGRTIDATRRATNPVEAFSESGVAR
jgi:hypothetical protein